MNSNSLIYRILHPFIRFNRNSKLENLYKKYKDHTMISKSDFILNLELMRLYRKNKGDIIECGTWKGGMIAAMAEHFSDDKTYYLVDSFEGLPEAKEIDGKAAKEWQKDTKSDSYYNNCKADESEARKAMEMSKCKNYKVVKGWFKDVLPGIKPENGFAVVRLDGDWYESTMEALENLYPKLNKGGIVVIDDYKSWDGCARAVHDYFSKNNLNIRLREYNNRIIYFLKID